MPTPGFEDLPRLAELAAEYEIRRELGRGGTAVVYLARERELGRDVAIKVIRSAHVEDDEAAGRLVREARTVARLQHPNIVVLYGTRRLRDGSLALIMQYIAGRTLKEEIAAVGPLPFARAQQILADTARALGYAHRHRIVHRDIKPENIYLDATTGVARLSDFGIARPWDADSGLTLPGSAIGTPAYMSPEQIDGAPLDGRSDLYGLGMIGYEMLSGARPWAGENLYSIIYKQKREMLPPLEQVRPGLPPALRRALEGTLAKDRAQRWPDADRFLEALGESPVGGAGRAPAADAEAPPRDAHGEEPHADSLTIRYRRDAGDVLPVRLMAMERGPAAAAQPAHPILFPVHDDADDAPDAGEARRPGRRRSLVAAALPVLAIGALVAVSTPRHVLEPSASPPASPPPAQIASVPATDSAPLHRPAAAIVTSGTLQDGLVGDTLREPLVVRVLDADGNPVVGMGVRFRIAAGEGALLPHVTVTDATGAARTRWVLLSPGAHHVVAEANGLAARAEFAATATVPAEQTALPPSSTAATGQPAAVPGPARDGDATAPAPLAVRPGMIAGATHSCALAGDGSLSCWGGNDRGQLGDGSTTRRDAPVRVSAPEPFAAVAAGVSHTCSITAGGAAYCWGGNAAGQLGDGTQTTRLRPVRVATHERLTDVAAGAAHACALGESGALFCWGENGSGQLGDGSRTDRSVPVRAGGDRRFRSVSLGWSHTCALTTDGVALCWGRNSDGQLGDGSTADRASAVAVAGGHRFTALAAGSGHSCGLRTDGAVLCWGLNSHGQLGTGTTTPSPTPIAAATAGQFTALTLGALHSCALAADGTAFCWGRNNYGQIGDGSMEDRLLPAAVMGPRFTGLVASGAHACGNTGAGWYCWGFNLEGQLGDGSRTNRSRPAPVSRTR